MNQPSAEPASILVVDDNEQNRALVRATLEDEHYRVVLAASGPEGLTAFAASSFDCVLLDVRMPVMSGFEVCRAIRARPERNDVPIVFLTALRDVDTFDEARAAGGDDFLTKPLRPTELLVRVQAALELRRLSAENRGHYQTIREQRDAMTRLQLEKEQLTAFLVHDLKNPVNALDLHAQLLLRDKTLSERARDSARAIRQEARRLHQLISNMLDISKGEAGALPVRRAPLDLRELLEELLPDLRVRADSKGLRLATQIEFSAVHADADLLRRVLENLVDNAIRHAPPGTVVDVGARRSDGAVELFVADQGSGVPEAMRTAVFERFVQAGSPGLRREGHGLGLAFCKLVLAAHGGSIWVEDGCPGAVFRMRLPDV